MEPIHLISTLIVFFSMMLTPCVSVSMQIRDQSASLRVQDSSRVDEMKSFSPTLPRKLRVLLIVNDNKVPDKDVRGQVFGAESKQHKAELSGKRDEWKEASEFMTMDYRPVKKRRPIHNRSVPLSP